MRESNWSIEEDEYLKENWQFKTRQELAEALGRSPFAVDKRREFLGFTKRNKKWTKEDEKFLIGHKKESLYKQAKILGRSVDSINSRRSNLGLCERSKAWTEQEDVLLRKHYNEKTDRELGSLLGKTTTSVYSRRIILKLYKEKLVARKNQWKDYELTTLRTFSTKENFLFASELHKNYLQTRTIQAIYLKRKDLKLPTAHIQKRIILKCQYCYKKFKALPSTKSTKHFCSKKCQVKARIKHYSHRIYLEVNDEMAEFLLYKGRGKNNYLRNLIEEDMRNSD